jgi:hypothetical protein
MRTFEAILQNIQLSTRSFRAIPGTRPGWLHPPVGPLPMTNAKWLLALSLSLLSIAAAMDLRGQWGIQGTMLHYEPLNGRQGLNWTVGFVHDPSPRTSIALEVLGHWNIFSDPELTGTGSYDGYNVLYSIEQKTIGLQYRSSFFLTQDDRGLYLGPLIGFRKLTRTVDPTSVTSSSFFNTGQPAWARRRSEDVTLIPLAMRLGYRTELEGWFMDLYVTVGTTLGTGTDPLNAPYLEDKEKLRGLFLQLGYALGLGW